MRTRTLRERVNSQKTKKGNLKRNGFENFIAYRLNNSPLPSEFHLNELITYEWELHVNPYYCEENQ
jgi:hypothetical protein